MPNWCSNVVEIAHKDPAKLKEVIDAFKAGNFCNYAKPLPEDLNITAGSLGHNTPEQLELEAKEKANLEKHGYKNWYDFCANEWGTKWDVTDETDGVDLAEGDTDATISFESAWAPPIGCYEALVEQGFEVRAYYYEPGMCFAGIWDNGDDDFVEYGGYTSDQVAEDMPILDEMFAISESMREYEEENADEE